MQPVRQEGKAALSLAARSAVQGGQAHALVASGLTVGSPVLASAESLAYAQPDPAKEEAS
jgi:hypothetical protein